MNGDKTVGDGALASHLWVLTKPGLSFMSVVTVVVGYLVALPERPWYILPALFLGTALAAGGCAALNQGYEYQADALMKRTQSRPIPSGALTPRVALGFGFLLCVVGDAILIVWVGVNAALLTLLIQIIYICMYTPLKMKTPWNTEVGAITGALPPLVGWAAAQPLNWGFGWILFGMLFAWQMPHFMALAQMYREDYANAGFKMLSVTEPTGKSVAGKALWYTCLLCLLSLLPLFFGFSSFVYAAVAFSLGLFFIFRAFTFTQKPSSPKKARGLFLTSIIYLPLLLIALTVDRLLIL